MREKAYSFSEIKKTLRNLEAEATQLKSLCEGIPAAEKNIRPILTFIDILKFHLDDLNTETDQRRRL